MTCLINKNRVCRKYCCLLATILVEIHVELFFWVTFQIDQELTFGILVSFKLWFSVPSPTSVKPSEFLTLLNSTIRSVKAEYITALVKFENLPWESKATLSQGSIMISDSGLIAPFSNVIKIWSMSKALENGILMRSSPELYGAPFCFSVLFLPMTRPFC